LQRFFGEARAAATIRSPHVVQILDHGVDPLLHLPFIVMELLEGETLEQRLTREGTLEPVLTAKILSQVARALTRVHEANMVHRDLKPSNVFLVANEEDLVAKVLDFGIAKGGKAAVASTPVTATGQQMGTPYYMSPEQIRGWRDIDFKADLWAFGVIAFECLTGRRPFNGETLGDLSLKICVEQLPAPSQYAQVPHAFDAWFERAVHRDRAQTFGSAKEAADALRSALGSSGATSAAIRPRTIDGSTQAPAASIHPLGTTSLAVSSSEPQPAKKRRAAAWLAVIATSGAVGAGSFALYRTSEPTNDEPIATAPSTGIGSAASLPPDLPNTIVEPVTGSPGAAQPDAPPQPATTDSAAASQGPSPSIVRHPGLAPGAKPRVSARPAPERQAAPLVTAAPQPAEPLPRTGHDLIENRL
jgi:serine/threonine-protein kinase